jgi:anaerobic selenocysteine-containing dehydrogenase
MLAPSGVSLEALRAAPEGVRVTVSTRYRKHETDGFQTPTGLIEVYAERLLDHGHDPLPHYAPPATSPEAAPALAGRFPLRLTSAKTPLFCQSQHRNLPSLIGREPDPSIDMHPEAAAARGLGEGDWVRIETPIGSATARLRLRTELDPDVVVGHHGWWRGRRAGDANYNALIGHTEIDPISGAPGLRSTLCQIAALS